jgi:hypothetical protein
LRVVPVTTDHFAWDGRGPVLSRWLYHSDELFPGTFWDHAADGICGAEFGIPPDVPPTDGTSIVIVPREANSTAWVIFHGLQVSQFVPDEVHTGWQFGFLAEDAPRTGVWEVLESEWLKSFSPRHLQHHRHFVLVFYDDVVEVIARELIFGRGEFRIEDVVDVDPRFAYAYMRRAQSYEDRGDRHAAAADYRRYAAVSTDQSSAAFANRVADRLEREAT